MPNIPTGSGIFVPNGYLNLGSFSSPSGQSDPYGNIYPSGLTPGKVVHLSAQEARMLAAPGTTLYDGAYQMVQLDPLATAANASNGLAAYIRTNASGTQGTLPETAYEIPMVTTSDQVTTANQNNLFAGVFLNPATFQGQSNLPTVGNYLFIWVGAGRATVQLGALGAATTFGSPIVSGGAAGVFTTGSSGTAFTLNTVGVAAQTPVASNPCVMYSDQLFYRIGGQGV